MRQSCVFITLVHILAIKPRPGHAKGTGTVVGTRGVSASGSWMASSMLGLALINVYKSSKMGQGQEKNP